MALSLALPAAATTLQEAVQQAVNTSPAIEAARANRRATELELEQSKGRRLPRAELYGDVGEERIDRPRGFAPDVNDEWRTRRQVGVVLSQPIFDGWERVNDIYRNAARVDSAAARVLARSEVLALDAVEAFIDVRRHRRILSLAEDNVKRHERIIARVRDQIKAGKAAASEEIQVKERLAGAKDIVSRIKQALLETEAKYVRVVGAKPGALSPPPSPPDTSKSRADLIAHIVGSHPQIRAADAEIDAATAGRRQVESARYPDVALELRGTTGQDLAGTPGRNSEASGKFVMRWQLYDGEISRNKVREATERIAQLRAERDERLRLIVEELDKARATTTTSVERIRALRDQLKSARDLVAAYDTEYLLAKRTLLDVLTAEAAKFQTEVQLTSSEAVNAVAGFRMLAASGRLLEVLRVNAPPEANVANRVYFGTTPHDPLGLEKLR
ncbi:MAG: hypothetical protein RL291_1992 [Pseudomonadota bacterium]